MAINYVLAKKTAGGAAGVSFGVDGTQAAIDLAAANGTISGNAPALALVNAITTENPVSDVVIKYDAAVVTTANALADILRDVIRAIRMSGKAG
jgi:hypothetical protein